MADEIAGTDVGGAPEAAHFCKAPTPEEVESWRQHWRAEYEAEHPPVPAPPLGNRELALDLTGDGIRPFEFHGAQYELQPTPYRMALDLIGIRERLNVLAEIGNVTGDQSLRELRDCYATIATLGGGLLTEKLPGNPFLDDGEQADLHRLLLFLLDPGDTMPNRRGDGQPITVNAAHELMAYRAVYREPTTWRAFCAGCACIARQNAERNLELYYVVTAAGWGNDEARGILTDALKRGAGQ